MATGGVFKLLTNDGKQDRMLMASDLLRDRLMRVASARKASGRNPTPTLADIERTHMLFVNATYKPFAAFGYEYQKVTSNNASLGSRVSFEIPQFGDFFSDMALHVTLTGASITPDTEGASTFRFADYPGERLCEETRFYINGNKLDEYRDIDYAFYRKFRIAPQKMVGWKRCVGQEVPVQGEVVHTGAPDGTRTLVQVASGPQTPRTTHEQLEMFVPLKFWFNCDPRLAIPSIAIPLGQRRIEFKFARPDALVGQVQTGDAVEGTLSLPSISDCELYVNNIFLNPEVHDIYIQRIGFNLVRVHRIQEFDLTTAKGDLLLNELKWPIEYMFLGARADRNLTAPDDDEAGVLDTWHHMDLAVSRTNSGSAFTASYYESFRLLDRLTLKMHGISIYDDFPGAFYNAYLPYRYGATTIVTPDDSGALYMPFNLYPGVHQPSGHINASRAREIHLIYSSESIGKAVGQFTGEEDPTLVTAKLFVSASALNFLLVSDGSAVLRYST